MPRFAALSFIALIDFAHRSLWPFQLSGELTCSCLDIVVVGSKLSTASDAPDNTGSYSIIIVNVSKSSC
jgi:hypothetical protein